MNWATIRNAIKAAVVASTGIADVQWRNSKEAGGWRGGENGLNPYIDLVLRSPQTLGQDETRYTFNAGTDQQAKTQVGNRRMIVSVRIHNHSQAEGEEAVGALASLLRTRLHWAGVLANLRTAGVALSAIQPTVDADFTEDDREVSLAIVDVVFLAGESDTDTTATGDYIQSVEIESDKLRDVDGTDLPADLQIHKTITG